jgi:acyl phosphate:glycerol-3-phosphate acyltransferase
MSEFLGGGMHWSLALALAYLSGSVPTAYLAGRLLKGVDLRTIGSGNLGATNVYRNLGAVPAVIVLLLDAAKGALPVLYLPGRIAGVWGFETREILWWGLACGVAAIVGHAKPIFLLWKGGGKGVATAAGVFAALAPAALGIALVVFVGVAAGSGFVSLASIAAAVVLPIAVAVTLRVDSPAFYVAVVVAAFVVWSHRANLARLRAGTEPKTFGKKKEVV